MQMRYFSYRTFQIVSLMIKSKKDSMDQESIQSKTTPVPGYLLPKLATMVAW